MKSLLCTDLIECLSNFKFRSVIQLEFPGKYAWIKSFPSIKTIKISPITNITHIPCHFSILFCHLITSTYTRFSPMNVIYDPFDMHNLPLKWWIFLNVVRIWSHSQIHLLQEAKFSRVAWEIAATTQLILARQRKLWTKVHAREINCLSLELQLLMFF